MGVEQGLCCSGVCVCGGVFRVGWLHVRKEEEVLIPCPNLLVVDTKQMLSCSYWIPVQWTCCQWTFLRSCHNYWTFTMSPWAEDPHSRLHSETMLSSTHIYV